MHTSPSITLSLTRYAEPDWLLLQTLNSLASQQNISGEVLFFDQAKQPLLPVTVQNLSTPRLSFRCERIEPQGLSHARNLAIDQARHDIILFIDSDAIASPDWASQLASTLATEQIGVAGGRILPNWGASPPWLVHAPFILDQYSMLDLGTGTFPTTRIVGANFGIRRDRLGDEAYFNEALGRRDGRLFGGEESELCERTRALGLCVLYAGAAVVDHQVLPERLNYRWLFRRFYYAGLGRATLGGLPQPRKKLVWKDYPALAAILPSYVLGFIRGRLGRVLTRSKPASHD